MNEPPKGLLNESRTINKPSISEDFWTTSTWDMDNSAVQSQGSMSSISTNQTLDPHGGSGSNTTPSEFVNHGKFFVPFEVSVTLLDLHVHMSEMVKLETGFINSASGGSYSDSSWIFLKTELHWQYSYL